MGVNNNSYTSGNASQRQRLAKLLSKLTDDDLNRPMPGGWTVATKLAHIAFWDQYALARLKKSASSLFQSANVPVDEVNSAARALSEAIPARAAAQLALASAEAVDAYVETIGAELRAAIEGTGNVRLLNRSLHRREHLDQIERALG